MTRMPVITLVLVASIQPILGSDAEVDDDPEMEVFGAGNVNGWKRQCTANKEVEDRTGDKFCNKCRIKNICSQFAPLILEKEKKCFTCLKCCTSPTTPIVIEDGLVEKNVQGWATYKGTATVGTLTTSQDDTAFTLQGNPNDVNGYRAYLVKNPIDDNWSTRKYERFNFTEKSLRFTIDLSGVNCTCVATLYFTAMRDSDGQGASNYCDAWADFDTGIVEGPDGEPRCIEVDVMEANRHAFHVALHPAKGGTEGWDISSTLGTNLWDTPEQKEAYGPEGKMIVTSRPFDVELTVGAGGDMQVALTQEGRRVVAYELAPTETLGRQMLLASQGKLAMSTSLWKGNTWWLDTCNAEEPETIFDPCSLGGTKFTVSNIRYE